MNFYVYEHWRPDKSEPFYVGKGRGRRAWSLKPRNPHHGNVIKALAKKGLQVEVKVVFEGICARDAYAAEIKRISLWKSLGVRLTNQTGGGEGMLEPTPELRSRLSSLLRLRVITPEWRANIAKGAANLPQESYARRSKSMQGIKRSHITRAKVSASKTNPSEETRLKNSNAAKNGWADDKVRAKQVAARLGVIRITDGVCNRTIRPGEEIPAGWRRGLTKRH